MRRALAELASDGYVQPMQGKGVRNIFQPVAQTSFTVGGIESFLESALRNHQKPRTKVLQFAELETGEKSPEGPAFLWEPSSTTCSGSGIWMMSR